MGTYDARENSAVQKDNSNNDGLSDKKVTIFLYGTQNSQNKGYIEHGDVPYNNSLDLVNRNNPLFVISHTA